MRTASQIVLVLLGGGLIAGIGGSYLEHRSCNHARDANDPRADEICRSAYGVSAEGNFSRNYSSASNSEKGGHDGPVTSRPAEVSRGGFGAAGEHFGGFGS